MIFCEKMASTLLISAAVLCLVSSALGQQLIVTHAPKYVTIQQQAKPLSASDVPDVITNTLGLSDTESKWTGLSSGSLFKRPKANVLLTVVTAQSSTKDVKPQQLASFPVDADLPLLDMSAVMNKIQSSFLEEEPVLLDLMADANMFDLNTPNDVFRQLPSTVRSVADRLLDKDSVMSRLNAGSLNRSNTPDLTLMAELQMIHHVLSTLKDGKDLTSKKTPDLFSFVITGLKTVADHHGVDSDQAKDANRMVSNYIDTVTNEFRQLYKDNVVVEVLTVPAPDTPLVRKARSLMQAEATPAPETPKGLNLAYDYHSDYPAMYNIVMWLSVVLIVAVFVIAYGMWNIDPGRDSVIYRMTTHRLKKD